MKHAAVTLLLCAVSSIASIALTLFVVFVVLEPSAPAAPRVAFSDFLDEVHAGRVEEIHVHDRVYRYRIAQADPTLHATKETIGPQATIEEVRVLRPTNPDLPAPKIAFDP